MILITGITGNVGGATAQALLDKGVKFRAIVRDKEKAADWAAKGVELVEGDLNDSAAVEAAMDGCDTAFLVMPNGQDQERLELSYIEAAKKAGIKHFVKLSSPEAVRGTTSPIPLAHIAAEDAVMASGMDWTLVRPAFFMQNLINYGAAARESGKISLPMGKGTISPTDCKDAGEFVAEVLTGEGHNGKCYDITGPEVMDFDRVAETFGEALGREVGYEHADPDAYKARIRPFLSSDWHSDGVTILFAEIANGTTPGEVTDTFTQIIGREPTSMLEYLRANL